MSGAVSTRPTGPAALPTEPKPPLPVAVSVPAPPSASPIAGEVVLDVQDLRTYFFTYAGVVKALDGVTFQLRRGETLGMVGETGCGKSVTAFSVVRLIPDPPGRIVKGRVLFRGADLLRGLAAEASFHPLKGTPRVKVSRKFRLIRHANERMEAIRGRRIAMIFQEPTQALNPVFSVANQVGEIVYLHRGTEVLDEMLTATPNAHDVAPAVAALMTAVAGKRLDEIRRAAIEVGRAAHSSRLATEAFYIARAANRPPVLHRDLLAAIAHLRISPFRRQYLVYRRRLLELREQTNRIHIAELSGDLGKTGGKSVVRARMLSERLRHFYFGVWGVRRWVHKPLDEALFWRVVRILEGVHIANPVQVARGFPHELSGGMLQRVMIAMALSAEPDVLLADEPTTALDVTIQAQILELIGDLRRRIGTAILLITHDLAVLAEVADRVCVMYAGQIVEHGTTREIYRQPLHPYTQGLLASVPRMDHPEKELSSIPGSVPDLLVPPNGCRFHPRCPYAMPICRERRPPMTQEGPDHTVACYLYKGPRVGG